MPDLARLFPAVAVALLAIVLVWFTVGTQLNVRRGNRTMAWLQEGLPLLGPRATLRWLGSSVAVLGIVEPRPPFREAEVLVVLEPRDLGAIWALARRRGRRDFLIVRTSLLRAPQFEAELLAPTAWKIPGGGRADEALSSGQPAKGPDGQPYEIRDDGQAPIGELTQAWDALSKASGGTWRISVRRTVPHLEIQVLPPDLHRIGSAQLVTAARELAERVAQPTRP